MELLKPITLTVKLFMKTLLKETCFEKVLNFKRNVFFVYSQLAKYISKIFLSVLKGRESNLTNDFTKIHIKYTPKVVVDESIMKLCCNNDNG